MRRFLLFFLLWSAAAVAFAAAPPRVLVTGGTYIGDYRSAYESIGCDPSIVAADAFAAERLEDYQLLHVDNWKEMPEAARDRIYDFVRRGGRAIFSLQTIPDRRYFGTATMPRTATGWAGDIAPAPGNESFFRTVRGSAAYTGWGAIIYADHLPRVTVLANWTMPQNTSKIKMMPDEFKQTAPAVFRVRVERGELYYAGALLAKPSCIGILRGIVNHLFPATDALRELEEQLADTPPVRKNSDGRDGRTVAVFREPGFPASGLPADVTPETIAEALRADGIDVEFVDAAGLAAGLDAGRYAAFVASGGETIPLAAIGALRRYAADGGGFVFPAGVPMLRPYLKTDGQWREIADGGRRESVAALLFEKFLPFGKFFTEESASATTVLLAPELLPGLPLVWPFAGSVGVMPVAPGSQRAVARIAAALDAGGTVRSVPLTLTAYNRTYPAARFVCSSFTGERHPWSRSSWPHADRAIAAMTRLAMNRDHAVLTDLYPVNALIRPGEKIAVRGSVAAGRTLEVKVRISLYAYGSDRRIAETIVPVRVEAPKEGAFRAEFELPESPDARYDLIAELIDRDPPAPPQRTMQVVDNGAAPRNRAAFGADGEQLTVAGRPARLNGANLYFNEGRAAGIFFLPASNPRALPDVWNRDIDLLLLTGGNATRQHYFESQLDERSFRTGRPDAILRRLDAYLRLHDLADAVPILSPLTFSPINFAAWKKRFPNAVKHPYVEPAARRAVLDYLAGFARFAAPWRNVAYEIINEPELHTPSLSAGQTAADIRAFLADAANALEPAGRAPVGIGNTHNYDTTYFNPRESLSGIALWSNIHPYYMDSNDRRARKSTPFGLNFGRPCLIGEIGMPNPHSSNVVKLGEWGPFYENTFALALAERAAGFQNFYLANTMNYNSPEWGLLRADLTEKGSFGAWKRWTRLSRLLPPDRYLPETDALLYFLEDRDGHGYNALLAATYLGLQQRGVNCRIRTVAEAAAHRPRRAWVAHTARTAEAARKAVEELRRQGVDAAAVPCGEVPDARPADRELALPAGAFRFLYAMPRRDGGRTFVFSSATGRPAELRIGKHRYQFTPAPDSPVVLDTLPSGEPRLVQMHGSVRFDGRELAGAPEPYLIAAPEGESLTATSRARLFAENQRRVRTDVRLADAIPDTLPVRVDGTLPPDLRAAFAAALAANGRTLTDNPSAPALTVTLGSGLDGDGFGVARRDGRWPEVRFANRRLLHPWSALLTPTADGFRLDAGTPAGLLAGLLRVADLRNKERWSIGPAYPQD